jgi:predicted lipoprotein with Yx(FWY)xxD motif
VRLLATIATFLVLAGTAAGGTVVKAAYNTRLKAPILVTARGLTLYAYVSDRKGATPFPSCTNDSTYHCSRHWIPLRTTGAPKAGAGVKQRLLGTVARADGGTQVTYAGHPLYTWIGGYGGVGDARAGDLNGQAFASLWYVLSPAGAVIHRIP